MRNPRDPKTKVLPSTTRTGKELPSSSALDSPSILSKLATPKPASAIRSDMSHVIDDATSAMHDAYDETTSMLDNTVPLGEFLDEQLARARENEIIETDGKAFSRPWFGQLMTGPQLMAYLIQVNMWLERYQPEIEI